MNPLMTGAILGSTCAGGALMVWQGLTPSRPQLADLILGASKARPTRPASAFDRGLEVIVMKGSNPTAVDADLAVLGRTRREFAISRLSMAAAFGGLPIAVTLLTTMATGTAWNPIVIVVISIVGAAAGFALGRATLASEATERRQSFVAELAAYLDIVAQLLTGGAGVEDALWRASRNARSPGIMAIRDTLASARTRRRSEWVALGELATRTRVSELTELVIAVQLAGTSGAKVAASLVAKAHSLRDRNASQQLAAAQRSSERMGGPLIAMLLSFLVLVIAPALAAVMSI